ncbi:tRNA dihydrouridine synthase DusB [Paracoccus shanxieyensis]|uniref:tRNA-dihydrouridine synthase n=1 Tax=Paracoccus shanxieyensis TaxID=2675752 RepID=A0A6L6J059_9RHOB|nr:tRNA dihydrouridine synthase DusB [Paracoccus shanxieyensis]MTH64610.1 tRNA dihydrouridine synthase DusB [Paracoccus shanxieyensis]MTH87754.1 tRNA dihydrouridine synthase DusB [Paracoccus shanxieyensis]
MSMPQPITLGQTRLGPSVFLAPMAGITDLPFRRAVARHGGAGLMVSEMVASTEMVTPRPSNRAAVRAKALTEGALPVSVQIAGREAAAMAETARIVAGMGARIVDINMGCPAKKVTGGLSGAALMRDLDHALSLIDAVVAAVPDLPVTLKMRLGWDEDCLNAAELAARATDAGVRMLTVHGRTRAQFYTGQADWSRIRQVANLPGRPPLVANGDVVDAASARMALSRSGAEAVMVGRGAQGAPWKLAQIAHKLWATPAPAIPEGAALSDAISEHYEDILSFYGNDLGLRVARKHLGWYAEANGAPNRAELMRAASAQATLAAIRAGFGAAAGAA